MKMPSCVSALKMLAILSVFASSAMAEQFAIGKIKSIEAKESGVFLVEVNLDPSAYGYTYAKTDCGKRYKDGTRFAFSTSAQGGKAMISNLTLAFTTGANVSVIVDDGDVCDVSPDSRTMRSVIVE
ncbi:MAG: hypothetical protein IPK50_04240 [Fibrobacterota bacterium]|nr:MAG: hypothetical protein IPK50_04240 [Fibrobacterota bacterium]